MSAEIATAEMTRSPFPMARPGSVALVDPVVVLPNVVIAPQTAPAMTVSLVPQFRPKTLKAPRQTQVSYRTAGSVCGHRDIRGTAIKEIQATLKGCGLSDPVRITEISGVKLFSPAIIDCTTAKALRTWIDKGAKPAVGRKGGGLSELKVVASYSCRTRNNQPGAKVSEHGRGRAIDIAGFTLKNGDSTTVLEGWNDRKYSTILKKMHKSACGPFGTVLGPNANKYHKDHFHFDTARYRSGSYCR
ncbi:extensin family protein [Pacificibacter sp. AS14]|uniref:extensin-like domain-containing protein n=1 Tax=Pacificibacter sp. AS14 TaxID=3135785 RepID=UPI003181D91C